MPLLRLAGQALGFVRFTGKEPLVTPESAMMLGVELGYRPATLHTMVDDCCRWLIAEGFLKSGLSVRARQLNAGGRDAP